MGVKIKMKRKASLNGKEAIIESEVKEYMDKFEYIKMFTKKNQEKGALAYAMNDAKQRLVELAESEKKVSELVGHQEEMYKMMDLALKIKEAEDLKKKFQEMEVLFVRMEDEINSLKPIYAKLTKEKR